MIKNSNSSKQHLWFEQISDEGKTTAPIADELLIQLKDEAKKCLDADVANYNIKNSKTNSSFQWMKTVMSKGVVSDKIAAFIVMIQDSPIHTLDTLSNLIGMVKVGKKKECIIVVENLVELFLTNLLHPTRKLIPFRERPLNKLNEICSGNAITRKKYLSTWYFEDQLKENYALFVRQLNAIAHDTVDVNKEKALIAMHKLLAGNAEQEKNLLVYIVNKLGDPSRKVASKAIYCLTQLLREHSNMQGVVLGEIEKLLFRPNIASRAQYYGLCFLSQFYLCHETSQVARHLIEVYFSFFKACVKKGEVNSRMMSALLMGVNRAYPYAKLEVEKISDHINTMYRVVHVANFNVSLHALTLLYQVSDNSEISDRFYSALYRKLLDPQISNTTHQAMLLSLVYKAMSRDTQIERVKVLIKRLLQNAIYMQPSMACGILYIISQLLSKKHDLSALVLKASVFSAHDDEQNSDDEEEKYEDVKDEDVKEGLENESLKDAEEKDEIELDLSNHIEPSNADSKVAQGWLHETTSNINKKNIKNRNSYDGLCRNPLFAGGQFSAYTELNYLKSHFHPTVSLFAENLLKGETIRYTGDPLKDFSLIKFLDRFVFKNPKRLDEISKQGCHPMFGKRKNYIPRGVRNLAVNSKSYLNEKQQNIPVEEQYLYTFLHRRSELKAKQDEDEDEDSDVDSVASDEFEEMLDKMAGAHKDVDEDLDYMNAVGENLKSRKNKDLKDIGNDNTDDDAEDDDDIDDEDDMEDIDDDEDMMNEEDKELTQLSDEDEDSDIVFDSEDEEQTSNKKKKKVNKDDIRSLFASADEFASILEDEGGSSRAPGGSSTWSNKDNANTHQIAWEEKRNRWIKGYDNKMRKGKKQEGKKFSKNKSNNKRKVPNKNNFQNKKKKVK